MFINTLRGTFYPAAYPRTQVYQGNTTPKFRFRPVVEASHQKSTGLLPNHTDLHKTIRVVINKLMTPDEVDGIWFLGWNQTGEYDDPPGCPLPDPPPYGTPCIMGNAAWNRWTEGPLYAEAIQNEIGGQSEGIVDVWKEDGSVITGKIVSVSPEPKGGAPQGHRIRYRLAPFPKLSSSLIMRPANDPDAIVLGRRHAFRIHIVRRYEDGDGPTVHIIDEGYTYPPTGFYENKSPAGRYEGSTTYPPGDEMLGTEAYWDGKYDTNGGPDNDGYDVPIGTYRAYLYLDGVKLGALGEYYEFTIS